MAAKKGGLGRGLEELFGDNSAQSADNSSAITLKISDFILMVKLINLMFIISYIIQMNKF